MKKILLVEDDISLCRGIKLTLEKENFSICPVYSMIEAKKAFESNLAGFDLIILDINLPDGSGLELLKRLREFSAIPVIFLTSNDMETDIVEGFELGCNDYVTKPFSLMILRARVMALLNRGNSNRNISKVDGFIFDFDKLEFYKDGMKIFLSVSEQKLLKMLVSNSGQILTKSQLIDGLWGIDGEFVNENTLSANVKRLRQKLEDNPSNPKYIRTAYGLGYIWTNEQGGN